MIEATIPILWVKETIRSSSGTALNYVNGSLLTLFALVVVAGVRPETWSSEVHGLLACLLVLGLILVIPLDAAALPPNSTLGVLFILLATH